MAKAGDQYDFRTGNLWSVCRRDDLSTARRLVVDEGLDLEMRNKAGWAPLHAAASGGALRCLALLLDQSASVDPRCRAGRTPLIEAARNGHLAACKLLAKAGADLSVADGDGRTAMESAKGSALRSWLAERDTADAPPTPSRRHNGGRREQRAERQPTGASGKAKAKQLKEQRAAARQKRAHDRSGAVDEDEAAPAATAAHEAAVDAPLCRSPDPTGCCLRAAAPPTWDETCPVLSQLTQLSKAAAETGVAERHVACYVADARHPLMHLADGVVARIAAIGVPLVLVLSKADLVPPPLLAEWTARLAPVLPPGTAVVPFHANGRQLGDGGGVASRRRALSAPLSVAERARAREDAERLAAACGTELPPQTLEFVRGEWRTVGRVKRHGDAEEAVADEASGGESSDETDTADEGSDDDPAAEEAEEAPEAAACPAVHTVLHLIGRANGGKSSVANALACRRVAAVSRQPGHTQRVQAVRVAPWLSVRDTPPIDGGSAPGAWRVVSGVGPPPAEGGLPEPAQLAAMELSGMAPSALVRDPYPAVRCVAEAIDLRRAYAMQPNELDESGEPLDALSAYGLCCALAAKKGYRQSRSGAPDPHRAALLIARDCAHGALPLVSRVPDR